MLHNTLQIVDLIFFHTLSRVIAGPGPGILPALHCGSPLRSTTTCMIFARRPDHTGIALKRTLLLFLVYAYMLPQTLASSDLVNSCLIPHCMLRSLMEINANIKKMTPRIIRITAVGSKNVKREMGVPDTTRHSTSHGRLVRRTLLHICMSVLCIPTIIRKHVTSSPYPSR
jgi:hypothetical protein